MTLYLYFVYWLRSQFLVWVIPISILTSYFVNSVSAATKLESSTRTDAKFHFTSSLCHCTVWGTCKKKKMRKMRETMLILWSSGSHFLFPSKQVWIMLKRIRPKYFIHTSCNLIFLFPNHTRNRSCRGWSRRAARQHYNVFFIVLYRKLLIPLLSTFWTI